MDRATTGIITRTMTTPATRALASISALKGAQARAVGALAHASTATPDATAERRAVRSAGASRRAMASVSTVAPRSTGTTSALAGAPFAARLPPRAGGQGRGGGRGERRRRGRKAKRFQRLQRQRRVPVRQPQRGLRGRRSPSTHRPRARLPRLGRIAPGARGLGQRPSRSPRSALGPRSSCSRISGRRASSAPSPI